MLDKETYCHRILKSYSLIVDFDGHPEHTDVPSPVSDETFKQWKNRVLGIGVENVRVYMPIEPAQNQRISSLVATAQASHLEKVFISVNRRHQAKKKEAVSAAIKKTAARLSTISSDMLQDVLSASEYDLEPSVKEFFERFIQTGNTIDTATLLEQMVNGFNHLARGIKRTGIK